VTKIVIFLVVANRLFCSTVELKAVLAENEFNSTDECRCVALPAEIFEFN